MKSLEILDISKNKIRKMPDDFGTLMSLKVKKERFLIYIFFENIN
jgi:hypothetical protein